jgi:imidazolonepropionase-like amidohydrolase
MGSDSGNWPLFPFYFHGVSSLRELEVMAESGMPPVEVLSAATRTPSQMLGVSDRIGTLEPGKEADLVVVDGDPLQDIRALRRIRWTARAGVLRTPEEWMRVSLPG